MALSDFNENDYTQRQSGLQAWLNGSGNATPGVSAYPGQTPTAKPPINFGDMSPSDKAILLSQEATQPGSAPIQASPQATPTAAPSTAFRDTAPGAILGALMPQIFGAANNQSRGKALTDYVQSIDSSNDPTIAALKGMAAKDPTNGEKYAGAISQYMAQNQTPIARAQAEEAGINLGFDKYKMNKTMQGMQMAQDYFNQMNGGQPSPTSPAAQATPASGSPPVGVENNNLLNIKADPSNNWQGQTGKNGAFVKFDTQESGFRAGAKTLTTYAGRGINNIDDLVKTWAPAADHNDPESYAKQVSQLSGIGRGQSINLAEPETQAKLLNAMQMVEVGGKHAAPPQTVINGVQAAAGQQPAAEGAPPATAPAAQLSPLQQHQKLLAMQASFDPSKFGDFVSAIDPTNPANIPKQVMEGDTLFSQKPGEAPAPYAVPPMNTSEFKTGAGGVILPSKTFGSTTQPLTTATLKIAQDQDKAMQVQDQNNDKVVKGMQDQVHILKKVLPGLLSGPGMENINGLFAGANSLAPHVSPNSALSKVLPTSGGNWDKQAEAYSQAMMAGNALALASQKLDVTAGGGSKAGKINLLTTLASKPSVSKDAAANQSSLNELDAGIADHQTSRDLDQMWRERSPYGITDENTRAVDDALKTIYPLKTIAPNGAVTFNQHNADAIRNSIPDAIARPERYIAQAKAMSGGAVSYNPTAAADNAAAQKAVPAASTVMHFDAQGNLIK